jgi:hypothetical protein
MCLLWVEWVGHRHREVFADTSDYALVKIIYKPCGPKAVTQGGSDAAFNEGWRQLFREWNKESNQFVLWI